MIIGNGPAPVAGLHLVKGVAVGHHARLDRRRGRAVSGCCRRLGPGVRIVGVRVDAVFGDRDAVVGSRR